MAKVTTKLQLTLPKRLAERCGISPGDEVEFAAAGDIIHLIAAAGGVHELPPLYASD